ncbi:MAG: methyltransferase domain-containing protein, partial [Candidatus Thorarchaeota archaeon]
MNYGEDYFKSGNYADYLERGPRYRKLVEEIDDLFGRVSLRRKAKPVLDFGCAVGHIVKALIDLGYRMVYGYDISDWAIKEGNKQIGHTALYRNEVVLTRENYLTFILDVFEHLTIEEIVKILSTLNSELIIFRVPV